MTMDIVENRRARLKRFFSSRSIPPTEKSYMSQLINGKASFGEKAARRLEEKYGMGYLYLDSAGSDVAEEPLSQNKINFNCQELSEIAELMRQTDEDGRKKMLRAAQDALNNHTLSLNMKTMQELMLKLNREI